MCRSLTQLSDDDERMSVGSRGSVRVSVTIQHVHHTFQETSLHHLHVVFFTWTLSGVVVQSDLEAVGAYSGGVRDGECSCENQMVTNNFKNLNHCLCGPCGVHVHVIDFY